VAQIISSPRIDHDPVVITYREPELGQLTVIAQEARPEPITAVVPAGPAPDFSEQETSQQDPEAVLERLRRESSEHGYRDGYDAGTRNAEAELAQEIEGLRAIRQSLDRALARGIEGLEDVMVEIAFAAVCKMLGEAALTEAGVRDMVREAMRLARSKEGLVLRVSPADYRMLHAEPERARAVTDGAKIEIFPDERVSIGGCLLEAGGGTLDARLEVQLRQLLDTLTRARGVQGELP